MSRLKLFFVPETRANRPLWLLEELVDRGAPLDWEVERVDVKGGANRKPEYLAIHPHGQVPALLDGDQPIFETVAICLHLADRFLDWGLAPPLGSPLRAAYYQWAAYCPATLQPPLTEYHRHTERLEEEHRVPRLAFEARARFGEVARVLSKTLERRPFLLGEEFSMVDLLVAGDLNWARRLGVLADHAVLEAWTARQVARPAAKRAYARV